MTAAVHTPTLIAGPAAEPVTLAEMRGDWLRQDIDAEGAVIAGLITAAREWLERATDRALTLATWELRAAAFGPWFELPYPPLVSVTSVQYLDAGGALQTVDPDTYVVVTSSSPGWVELADGASWPTTAIHPEAVRVTFAAGASPPELAKTAIKLLAAHWYEHREGQEIPPAVQALAWALASHRF